MNALTKEIQARAKELLSSATVDAVLGFSRGSLPMARRPFLAKTPEQAEQLWWDEFCLLNLAAFLPAEQAGRTAIIAKGCDWRNLVIHRLEGRVGRLYVIGVACSGMLDPGKISAAAGGPEQVVDVISGTAGLTVQTLDGPMELAPEELYRETCRSCRCNSPGAADEWLPQQGKPPEPPPEGEPVRHRDFALREAHYREIFRNCLMCFACRDTCPLCYCRKCFADIEKTHYLAAQDAVDRLLDFHFMRAHHIAGRCTGCGACESACPMRIPVSSLALILNADLERKTGYIPGLNSAEVPPTGVFRPSYHESDRRRS